MIEILRTLFRPKYWLITVRLKSEKSNGLVYTTIIDYPPEDHAQDEDFGAIIFAMPSNKAFYIKQEAEFVGVSTKEYKKLGSQALAAIRSKKRQEIIANSKG